MKQITATISITRTPPHPRQHDNTREKAHHLLIQMISSAV